MFNPSKKFINLEEILNLKYLGYEAYPHIIGYRVRANFHDMKNQLKNIMFNLGHREYTGSIMFQEYNAAHSTIITRIIE